MRSQVLVKRYAQGLISSAKDEKEFESLRHQLREFQHLFSAQKNLQDVLISPFLPLTKKTEIVAQILAEIPLKGKAGRFLLLLVENNRLPLLPDILDRLPELWNEEQGIATFIVNSVIPLNDTQKKRLEEKLLKLEKRPVSLSYRIDPSLVAGLSIKKGNIVYDASLQGELESLKRKISEG